MFGWMYHGSCCWLESPEPRGIPLPLSDAGQPGPRSPPQAMHRFLEMGGTMHAEWTTVLVVHLSPEAVTSAVGI